MVRAVQSALEKLPLSEIFGPTIQGEGPFSGRLAWFVRFSGCNLSCSWCDTAYTWDATRYDLRRETVSRSVSDITQVVPDTVLVVLTGGEPLLQQGRQGWVDLLAALQTKACTVHVETNGTIAPDAHTIAAVDAFVVSPKLLNAGEHRGHQKAMLRPEWTSLAKIGSAHLKVVCTTANDVRLVKRLAIDAEWPLRSTWVMPEGSTPRGLELRWHAIATAAVECGLNVTHRLQVLTWGAERGH